MQACRSGRFYCMRFSLSMGRGAFWPDFLGSRTARPSPRVRSEYVFQGKLNDPGIACRQAARSAGVCLNLAEGSAVRRGDWNCRFEAIRKVECLGPKLKHRLSPGPGTFGGRRSQWFNLIIVDECFSMCRGFLISLGSRRSLPCRPVPRLVRIRARRSYPLPVPPLACRMGAIPCDVACRLVSGVPDST